MKRFICLLLVCILFFSCSVLAFADYDTENENGSVVVSVDEHRAEETIWYYRVYNGLLQRRLWSITYGYWLTDWETIGYVDP